MATLIRLKRKKSKGNKNVELKSGEPYYNLKEKKLFVGNAVDNETENALLPDQKHIAQITNTNEVQETAAVNSGDATVKFTVGEATDNKYEKTVNNVAITKGIILDPMYFGNETDRNNLASKMGVDKVPKGTVFFQEAE